MWKVGMQAPISLTSKALVREHSGRMGRRKGYFQHNHGKSPHENTVKRNPTIDQSFSLLEEQEFTYNRHFNPPSDFQSFLSETMPDPIPAPYLHPLPLSPKRPKGPYFRRKKPIATSLTHIDALISQIKSSTKLQTLETQAMLKDFQSMRSHLRLPSIGFTRQHAELPPLQATGYSGTLPGVPEWE